MWRAEYALSLIHYRGVHKLIIAIDHDGCGKLVNSRTDTRALQSLVDAIRLLCRENSTSITLCSFSNRQSDYLNSIMSEPHSLAHLKTIAEILATFELRVTIDETYYAEEEYKHLQTAKEVRAFEKTDSKSVLASNIQKAHPNSSFLFIDDKYHNLPPTSNTVHHLHFSPQIWPSESILNTKMF